ncbi:polyphosphate glucokinase [Arthrobacter sp. NicSoilE8]|nr:polyphosphate glucokinase [Arthrobacter sp. NicSoilE8]
MALSPSHIGIDIGGTSIKGGIVELETGKMESAPTRVETPRPADPRNVADAISSLVDELRERSGSPGTNVPVGVAFPGIIQSGVARSAANMDDAWIGSNVSTLLSGYLGRPPEVTNDCDAAALAEVRYGAGQGIDGLVLVITLGTGVGSAMIFNGCLVPNAELGHLEIDGCGAETKASAVARERNGVGWAEYSETLQRYFSHLEFLFSPQLFIVGGGISERAEDYLPRLKLRTPIVPAALKNDAGIIGAALQVATTSPANVRV